MSTNKGHAHANASSEATAAHVQTAAVCARTCLLFNMLYTRGKSKRAS